MGGIINVDESKTLSTSGPIIATFMFLFLIKQLQVMLKLGTGLITTITMDMLILTNISAFI